MRSNRDATAVIEANGGKVLGRVRAPINSNDFSSYLLQAQSSKAKVIGLAIAGGDAINTIKQAASLGSSKAVKISLACCCGQAMLPRLACRLHRAWW
jgi:ABC-type branched-subunit amino acid transport system substrate-binding protein